MTRALLVLLALAFVVGCANADHSQEMGMGASPPMSRVAQAGLVASGDFAGPESDARMILRTGEIAVVVAVPGEAADQLTATVDQLGGFVSDSRVSEDAVHLVARVPSSSLESFLDVAAALGEEERRAITGQDVTDAYSDLQAEIGNLVALRNRLRVLLDKARSVEEVLKVERELTRVQTRLDALESRRQRMAKDVAMSRVDVYLEKEPERRVLGPVGLLYEGVKWVAIKLWVISP